MDKVLTRQLVRHALALGVLTLVHCGIGKDVGNSVGDAIGKGITKSIGCAVSQDLSILSEAVSVDIEQTDIDQLFHFIADKKVTTAAEFWGWQDAASVNALKDKLAASYVALPSDSSLRTKTVDFYNDLLALDIIAAQAKKNATTYRYSSGIQGKDGKTTLYTVEVSVQHSTLTPGRQVFTDCK